MQETLSWENLTADINRLYEEQRYAEAEAIAIEHGGRFPERLPVILYTRMCLAALLGEPGRALTCFGEAIAGGFWFPDSRLRDDPDLASLQGNTEFERLAAVSLEREQAAQAVTKPVMEVAVPAGAPAPYPTLIALHGNNSSLEITMPFWKPAAQKGFLTALPQSGQPGGIDKFVWDDAEQAEQEVCGHFETLKADYPVDVQRVVVGGFSMGGRVACWLGLSQKLPVRGFIGAAPWLRGFEAWEPHIETAAARGVRAYLLVGDRDPGCYPNTLAFHKMLEAHSVPCQLKIYPGLRHVYPPDFDAVLGEALEFILE